MIEGFVVVRRWANRLAYSQVALEQDFRIRF